MGQKGSHASDSDGDILGTVRREGRISTGQEWRGRERHERGGKGTKETEEMRFVGRLGLGAPCCVLGVLCCAACGLARRTRSAESAGWESGARRFGRAHRVPGTLLGVLVCLGTVLGTAIRAWLYLQHGYWACRVGVPGGRAGWACCID